MLLLFALSQARLLTSDRYFALWKEFLAIPKAVEQFLDEKDMMNRFETVFKDNMDKMTKHNDEKHSWTQRVTQFSAMTEKEFLDYIAMSGNFTRPARVKGVAFDPAKYNDTNPSKVDWVAQGYVTPIKNQEQCGSCWAFSTTGGLEGAYYKKHKKLRSFSEQELVDCAKDGNQGCNGGLMDDAFKWVEDNGLCLESAYPYDAKNGKCKESSCTSEVSVKSYVDVGKTEDALETASANEGPISVAVDANSAWQQYGGGVLSHWRCMGTRLDHGVLLVGYDKSGSDPYWRVKNSWGKTWGESGFIRLQRGHNICGIANSASYPVVE